MQKFSQVFLFLSIIPFLTPLSFKNSYTLSTAYPFAIPPKSSFTPFFRQTLFFSILTLSQDIIFETSSSSFSFGILSVSVPNPKSSSVILPTAILK